MLKEIAAWRAYESFQDKASAPPLEAGSFSLARIPSQQIGDFIYISDDFKVREGARLTADLYVGKPLGFGLQGGVFLLQDGTGKVNTGQVLKVVFKFGIGGIFGMTNLEREWRVGRQLALLAEPGKALPGFMRTGAAIVTDSGQFRDDKSSTQVVLHSQCAPHVTQWCNAAIILERIVGHDVTKPVSKAAFCDVHYLQQMLHSVFTALHRAQRQLAFHHADLRLANIMEALPSAFGDNAPQSSMTPRIGTIQAAALFDSQHISGVLQHLPSSLESPTHCNSSSQLAITSSFAAQQSGVSQAKSQTSTLQQSKNQRDFASVLSQTVPTQFKMIDFGLADFRETYGAGYVTEKHDTLVHREPHRQPSLQSLLHNSGTASSSNKQIHSRQHPTPISNDCRSSVDQHTNSRSAAGVQQHGGQHQEASSGSSSNQRSRIEWISDDKPERRASRKFFPVPAALLPEMPLMERIYRYFWRRKGDVYALLWDMQRFIDGRVWPKEDELEVRLMLDLVRHVTGVRVRAWFAATDQRDADGNLSLRDVRRLSDFGFLYRNGGCLHNLRILSLRLHPSSVVAWESVKRPSLAQYTPECSMGAPYNAVSTAVGLTNIPTYLL